MLEVKNSELISPDVIQSVKMAYERNYPKETARKVLTICKEVDRHVQAIRKRIQESPGEVEAILAGTSTLAAEALTEDEIVYNYPVSPKFINGLSPFIQ